MRRTFTYYRKFLSLFAFLCLLIPWRAVAQKEVQKTITGIVIDKTNGGLAGVSVIQKGTTNGTVTDKDGNFTISLKGQNAVLLFRLVGFKTNEFPVGSRSNLRVLLEDDLKSLQEVVLIGYQGVQRRKTTGAIATVKGKDIENTPYASFDQALQGRVAGLSVLSTSGEPGASTLVNIRGSSNINQGSSTAPLYVIDNIIYDVNDKQSSYGSNPLAIINPNDIESIDVLKDASAAAIYGSRGSNGVIIVKTKRPKLGIPQIRLSTYYGVSDKPSLIPVVTGAAERRLKLGILYDQGTYTGIQNGLSPLLTDSLNTAFNNNTDWQGLLTQRATLSSIDASISGAEEKYSYKFAVNKYYEQGVLRGYDFNRLTPSLFFQVNPVKAIQFSTNVIYGTTKSKHGIGSGDPYATYPFNIQSFPSSFFQIRPAEQALYQGRYDDLRDDDRKTSLLANSQLIATLAKGLIFNSSFSYNVDNNTRNYFLPAELNNGVSSASTTVLQQRIWEINNYLSYEWKIKENHNFSALIGQGAYGLTRDNSFLQGLNLAIDGVKTVQGVAPGANLIGNSYSEENRKLSYFARFSYDYKGKYLFQANYRRDASSKYSMAHRWGNFPSVSAGWIISDEPFFKPLSNVMSFVKIRGSFGITGQDPSNYYAQYTTLISDASYEGSALANGTGGDRGLVNIPTYGGTQVAYPNYYSPAASPAIKWESSPQFNIGADINFFNDRINFTADYYIRNTNNQVFSIPVPIVTGYTSISSNFVGTRNTGVELTINTRNMGSKSAFQWSTNFNIAYNQNYVTKLPNGNRDITYGPPYLSENLTVGKPLFYYNSWIVNGVYRTNADVPVDPLTGLRLRHGSGSGPFYSAGDPIRKDVNGDYIIDDKDRVENGSPNPKFTGGFTNTFSYKNFSLSILTTFMFGREIRNGYLSDLLQVAGPGNPYSLYGTNAAVALKLNNGQTFWQKPGDVATFPGLIGNNVDKWNIAQSTYVQNGSFIRVRSARLSYSLPAKLASRYKLQSIRIYSIVDNIYLKKYANIPDPELVNVDGYANGTSYPQPKKITLGLDLVF